MPDLDRRDSDPSAPADYRAPDYRATASSLHDKAERARFPEAKENLDRVARCYEVLAKYVERRRKLNRARRTLIGPS